MLAQHLAHHRALYQVQRHSLIQHTYGDETTAEGVIATYSPEHVRASQRVGRLRGSLDSIQTRRRHACRAEVRTRVDVVYKAPQLSQAVLPTQMTIDAGLRQSKASGTQQPCIPSTQMTIDAGLRQSKASGTQQPSLTDRRSRHAILCTQGGQRRAMLPAKRRRIVRTDQRVLG